MEIKLCDKTCRLDFYAAVKKTEQGIIDFFIQHRILPYYSTCKECGSVLVIRKSSLLFHCNRKRFLDGEIVECHYAQTARFNSFLYRNEFNIYSLWCMITSMLFLPSPHRNFVVQNVGISSKLYSEWSFYVREVYVHFCEMNTTTLGGPGTIVELDEGKLGTFNNIHRTTPVHSIIIGFERQSKKTFIIPVIRRTPDTLMRIVQNYIHPGSTIVSECWETFNCLSYSGYLHLTELYEFVGPKFETMVTNRPVHSIWQEVTHVGSRYGSVHPHYIGVLAEFVFKRIITDRAERLHSFFETAASLYPVV